MKRIAKKVGAVVMSLAVAVSGITIGETKTKSVKAANNWNLVWSDEFNGTSLDRSVWSYEIGNGNWGWGNGEIEYYTNRTDNVRVAGGSLQIIAKKENYGGQKYTSGRIISKGKKYFKYGKMEARIKVENGNQDGVWPAYWMMGENMNEGVGWPYCGEIDIMEHANSNNYVGGCLHWNTNGLKGEYSHGSYGSGFDGAEKAFGYYTDNENNGINGWHTYTLIWDANHMEWQLDGKTYLSQSITSNNAYCFQKEQFFLFNLAIAGPDTGFTNNVTANDATFKTATMYVDYLRVYQQGNGTNTTTPSTTTKANTTTKPATTTKAPATSPVETITKVSYEDTDLVANTDKKFGTYFDTQDNSWGGGVTGTITDATNKGITVALDKLGTNRWAAQASLGTLKYYPGYTYKYNATITSDIDRTLVVKVVGNDDGQHDSPVLENRTINVKAGVPYHLSLYVTIPKDYTSELYLYYGLGKGNEETVDSNAKNTIRISNVSFSTTRKVIESETVNRPTTTGNGNKVTSNEGTTNNVTSNEGTTNKVTSAKGIQATKKQLGKTTVKKATKKKNSKKVSLKFKKVKGAKKYQVQFSKSKKFKKIILKKTVKKTKLTIKKKVLKNKSKLYVRVKAVGSNKWSKPKKVKIKK